MRIVLTGGGTGGHVTPILACANALKQQAPNATLIYIGERNSLSRRLLRGSGLKTNFIYAGKFRRYSGLSWWQKWFDPRTQVLNLRDFVKVTIGYCQSLWHLIRKRPAVVFVNGGYVGLPVGLAAWTLGIPMVIHESDAVAGLTNRLLAHFAKTIAVSWPTAHFTGWGHKRLVFTGNPIRKEVLVGNREAGRKQFKLTAKLPVVLVMGGSSGAQAVNQIVIDNLEAITERFQVLHVAGSRDHARVHKLFSARRRELEHPARYHLYDFLGPELKDAYAVSDIVVSRAGMNLLAEVAAIGKPLIIIPLPTATSDHQRHNAALMEEYQAAMVLEETWAVSGLPAALDQIQASVELRNLLIKGQSMIARKDAAERLAKEIMRLT